MAVGLTLKELAEKIGVSRTTVSRVMAGNAEKYRISKKTVVRVREAAEKYGLAPNQIAQNLRLQKTDTIGLLIPEIANPFFANLAHVAEQELRKAGKMIVLCNSSEDTDLEAELLSMISRRQTDGLLVAPVGLSGAHFKAMEGRPVVFIDRYFPDLDIPHVATDNEEGAYMATSYLIEKGHQHIACIQGLKETVSNQDRVAGYQRALKEHQVTQTSLVLGDGFTIENGYRSTMELIESNALPTAIFTLNNLIAVGALQALNESGIAVPEKVSLNSFDEQPYFALTSPPVTTVKQPIAQIAREAVARLMDLLGGESVSSLALRPEIIERQSVTHPHKT